MFSAADHQFMTRALRLAERGLYITSPNPRVGCVIVKNGEAIGEGWTQPAGQNHAEVQALAACTADPSGADVYVTLEPCSHFGRTPPCADALIRAGVRRVVAAMRDPNPKVDGGGLERLRAQGVTVESGLMETQARELNIGFFSRMERKRPWVRLKVAASLDGATALENGVSQWITSESARHDAQHWRARSCAILTGVGTVLADNPRMSVRDVETSRQPLRVVVDSYLRTPLDANILQGGALLACVDDNNPRGAALMDAGAELLVIPQKEGRIDLLALLAELARREINELHVEAGATLNGALLAAGLVDEMLAYYAPTLLGHNARGMFDMPALHAMSQRIDLKIMSLDRIGQDIRLIARLCNI